MKISIVCPTLNRLAYLTHAVGQIQSQTYIDWELIVVEEFPFSGRCWDDERVSVHQVMWHSASQSRNYGAEYATGDLLWFIDDDNYYSPFLLEKAVGEFQSDPEYAIVHIPFLRHMAIGRPDPAPTFMIKTGCARKWVGARYWETYLWDSDVMLRTNYNLPIDQPLFYVIPAPTGGLRDPEGKI